MHFLPHRLELLADTAGTPRTVGPWTLESKVGEGGNATVWRAVREHQEPVALKVLHSSKVGGEPYRRFIREVEFLRGAGDMTGVLPLLDDDLPERPSSSRKAWLAMPLATPISEALGGASLDTIVGAVAVIAETLSRLQQSHGLAHRDLKPSNLYRWNDDYVVGDFGLISLPDVESLTEADKPIGPAHYSAYELIRDPGGAAPHPADVYSLAKTLWVLATEQRFPPSGHQGVGATGFRIQDLRPTVNAASLDQLVDSMTLLDPTVRPTMQQVARDLAAWLELPSVAPAFEIADLGSRFRAKKETEIAAADQLERNKELAMAAVRRFQELIASIHASLRAIGADIQIDAMDDKLTNNLLRSSPTMGTPRSEFLWQRCTRLATGPRHARYTLRLGRSVELLENGLVYVRAYIDVGYPNLNGSDFMWRSEQRGAPVDSVEVEQILQATAADITSQLRAALNAFVDGA